MAKKVFGIEKVVIKSPGLFVYTGIVYYFVTV